MRGGRLEIRPGVYGKCSIRFGEVLESVLEAFKDGSAGAIALFIGIVRREGAGGKKVKGLEIEAYKEHADKAIAEICRQVGEKYGVEVGVWHLMGEFEVGEPLVLVAVAGAHRSEVFQALHEAVERYKREPALFKKEVYVDGSYSWLG